MRPGSWTADGVWHSARASGVGAQAADRGLPLPGGFGLMCPGSLATDLGVHQSSLQVCAGAAFLVLTVQRLREWGHKRPQLLRRIL